MMGGDRRATSGLRDGGAISGIVGGNVARISVGAGIGTGGTQAKSGAVGADGLLARTTILLATTSVAGFSNASNSLVWRRIGFHVEENDDQTGDRLCDSAQTRYSPVARIFRFVGA